MPMLTCVFSPSSFPLIALVMWPCVSLLYPSCQRFHHFDFSVLLLYHFNVSDDLPLTFIPRSHLFFLCHTPLRNKSANMESDALRANRGSSVDAPAAPANPRDRDFNPITADLGNTSINPVADICLELRDGKQAEPVLGVGIANSGGGIQLHNMSTSESVASLADAFQRRINLAGSREEFPETNGCECQDAHNSSAGNERDGRTPQTGEIPTHPRVLSPRSTNGDVSASEPFPEYYESCEANSQVVDKTQEEAYNYAISKVIEEVIRFREVDSSIAALPTPPDSQIICAKEDRKEGDGSERIPTSREANKLISFQDLTQLLIDPGLKPSTQQRFMGLTNMVIRMEFLLFRKDGLKPPGPSLTNRDLLELNIMASEIMRYLSTVDHKLRELVDIGRRVAFILSEIAKERHISTWIRYRRMTQVVIRQVQSTAHGSTNNNRHLKKPRSLERRLLCAFLEFYDSHIYTVFLRSYDRHLAQETMSSARNNLPGLLAGLWDVLNRAIEHYELYVNMMVDMRNTFFLPVMEELARCPELWQESWDRHQE